MANAHKGEVQCGNTVLRLTTNALCELETVTDLDVTEVLSQFIGAAARGGVKLRLARAVIWAAMLHDTPKATLADAGSVIDDVGQQVAFAAIGDLIKVTFPAPEKAQDENPPKPEA